MAYEKHITLVLQLYSYSVHVNKSENLQKHSLFCPSLQNIKSNTV